MMESVKIGFIGTGNFARKVHYPSLARIAQAEITAICENKHFDRLEEVAAQYGVQAKYTDYHQMLAEAEIDAVYAIMRPTYGLAQIACDVLAAGKHLFVEKPPANSITEMQSMVAAAAASGCFTQVGLNRRYIPVLVEARRRAQKRGVISICATFYKHELRGDWYHNRKLMSNGIHAVDTLRWLANSEPREVVAAASKAFAEHENDNAWQALIRFENGVVGTLMTNYSAGARSHTFEIHAKEYSAYVDPDASTTIFTDGNTREPEVIDSREFAGSDEFIEYYGFRQEDQSFVMSILEGHPASPDFADALKSMELVERIERGRL